MFKKLVNSDPDLKSVNVPEELRDHDDNDHNQTAQSSVTKYITEQEFLCNFLDDVEYEEFDKEKSSKGASDISKGRNSVSKLQKRVRFLNQHTEIFYEPQEYIEHEYQNLSRPPPLIPLDESDLDIENSKQESHNSDDKLDVLCNPDQMEIIASKPRSLDILEERPQRVNRYLKKPLYVLLQKFKDQEGVMNSSHNRQDGQASKATQNSNFESNLEKNNLKIMNKSNFSNEKQNTSVKQGNWYRFLETMKTKAKLQKTSENIISNSEVSHEFASSATQETMKTEARKELVTTHENTVANPTIDKKLQKDAAIRKKRLIIMLRALKIKTIDELLKEYSNYLEKKLKLLKANKKLINDGIHENSLKKPESMKKKIKNKSVQLKHEGKKKENEFLKLQNDLKSKQFVTSDRPDIFYDIHEMLEQMDNSASCSINDNSKFGSSNSIKQGEKNAKRLINRRCSEITSIKHDRVLGLSNSIALLNEQFAQYNKTSKVETDNQKPNVNIAFRAYKPMYVFMKPTEDSTNSLSGFSGVTSISDYFPSFKKTKRVHSKQISSENVITNVNENEMKNAKCDYNSALDGINDIKCEEVNKNIYSYDNDDAVSNDDSQSSNHTFDFITKALSKTDLVVMPSGGNINSYRLNHLKKYPEKKGKWKIEKLITESERNQ
ncbi:uncharacterized protein LOC113375743 [Ctenocephalides felis]|uniref:uncharacterized protein LOC113375743 n=1 Tax=Ctenocephalides felis TaxID=7515 RepID=UPI000E6E2AED|nr:uncharacterized protein LOC113375743 [Ctenocephalides felis]